MKECQAPGLIGTCCRRTNLECFLKVQAKAESEENSLSLLSNTIDNINGCVCIDEVKEILQKRIENQSV